MKNIFLILLIISGIILVTGQIFIYSELNNH